MSSVGELDWYDFNLVFVKNIFKNNANFPF